MMRARCLCLIIVLTILFLSACGGTHHSIDQPSTDTTTIAAPAAPSESVTQIPTDDQPSTDDITIPTQTAPSEPVEEIRTDGIIYVPRVISYLGGMGTIPILLNLSEDCFPGMTVTFEVSANGGVLECTNADRQKFKGKEICADNFRYCNWSFISDDVEQALETDGAIFVSIVIRADGNIVGYGICEIGSDGELHFAAMRSETVIFPMQDGQLQQVTAEYVEEKLTAYKQTVTPFDLDEQYAKLQKAK